MFLKYFRHIKAFLKVQYGYRQFCRCFGLRMLTTHCQVRRINKISSKYPQVLVNRVSVPANSVTIQEETSAMEEDNADNEGPSMLEMPPNVLDLFHRCLDSWSEDNKNEAAIIENPNLREFRKHFVVIRNMIAQTRHS